MVPAHFLNSSFVRADIENIPHLILPQCTQEQAVAVSPSPSPQLVPSPQQLDAVALVQRLDSAIKGNPHLSGHQVFCSEDCGTVILQGRVRTYYQKQMAQESLRKLEGVERIVNDLQVEWQTTAPKC